MGILILLIICCLAVEINSIMIKRECPPDEVHKSCTFHEEYTCWVNEDRMQRVKISPKRLTHCMSGCFCKSGYVRQYPDGGCIVAAGCRDQLKKAMLADLPSNQS